ncbi:hypothetical protein WJX73_000104 [Symbiochloris irregularis]|uniref:Uncharacterized protein n=1 Tax=Symbiochloris irregularis TaxID=706552 RepID=A0AAW1NNK6_9CHLO
MGLYCASKNALEGVSDALRLEMRVHGIRVVTVRPGPINTPIWDKGRQAGAVEGSGDWHAYDNTAFKNTMVSGKAQMELFIGNSRNMKQPEDVAAVVLKAATVKTPKAHYVCCGNWVENWVLPNIFPTRMVDGKICQLFGIRRPQAQRGAAKEHVN